MKEQMEAAFFIDMINDALKNIDDVNFIMSLSKVSTYRQCHVLLD